MKKINLLALLFLALAFGFTACDDDPVDPVVNDDEETEGTIIVTENISEDVTWDNETVYQLGGRIFVLEGATLTIEPGTIIKGEAGTGTNATALVVARGGTLMAEGTADAPIIFTSVADEIEPGMIASPNLDPDIDGLWGGLIVLGYAPISTPDGVAQIEGIPPSDTNGLYGGGDAADPADNSGVLKYISIRHGGANIGEGNEINGLTLGGVGSGTTIENIEIIANQDDGIEPFGGTVDVSNVLVWNAGDDSFDCDQDYTGTINNFIGILGEDSDHGMELDGPEGPQDNGGYTLINGSIKGLPDNGSDYIDLRDAAATRIENVYFFNFRSEADVELDDAGSAANYTSGATVLSNLQFNVSHLDEGNMTIADIFNDTTESGAFDNITEGEASIVTTPTVGADKSAFTGWTWADANGELADF
ncbi:hypothetical protein MATR_33720 [Marivirga tractuosa]|uniref:Lipoprotein n=1 Tax=Marivirga tractuosa (strain ATCC 23168 / DSM 4126 / NBRC 15989 / NCIMB 1408 / VKM B-1430 / H-43) TaxID=643867 RepID=E4TRT3_MARTH|nr:hypothetical protein [Marivirga tractuosa]ADR22782.1 hypothetical protein Ftrac_2804 [Marivirga tractuosa DSM 4126]BDD16547.1 hypothetical protein MATR_33720 [Marivirga tractuosa]